ncbi:Acetyltransferase (GNAT) domain-containing protein [Actinomadura madurae]|uniref:Acetyltransferase (GNAT) domain-containing protein n=1 Tax=Actinomadura madurae TaxID=1993 RepID=A0A1I5YTQ6_9ACTN|nr:GNAT family N-acetyltransferase [Actinomadura madurae]SFQ47624.1 Acetyltransferase (GNAT) domain-containing protein [Actinomadura madurae]
MISDLTFSRHDPASAEGILQSVIVPVYVASHREVIDRPFYSAERFADRFSGYAKAPGFEIVIARLGEEPVGQAFGYALPPSARWWNGLTTPVPDGFTEETGSRTFALNELMVVPEWQGKGVAHALHDALLGGRAEERATLLVREDNGSAQRAYGRWGWRKIGKLRPFPDSPHFDAMILDLPPGAGGRS